MKAISHLHIPGHPDTAPTTLGNSVESEKGQTQMNQDIKTEIKCPTCGGNTDMDNCCPECTGIGPISLNEPLRRMSMKEITIVINENGWTETLKVGDKVITKRIDRTKFGSQGLDTCWEYDENAPEFAYEAFDNLSSGCYDAMEVLYGTDHTDDAHDEDEE